MARRLTGNSRRWRGRRTSGLKQKRNKEEKKIDKFFCKFQKLFQFGVQFQLDSKPIITSASKHKGIQLNTNIS